MSRAIIVDIDGTIADQRHRQHHVKKHPIDWDAYFENMADDPPFDAVKHIVSMYNTSYKYWLFDYNDQIFFCTARSEKYRKGTEEWLNRHVGVGVYKLMMRKEGDYRPAAVVKEEMLDTILLGGWNVLFAIDDQQSVVDMWRRRGITCLQMESHHLDDKPNISFDGLELLYMMVGPSGAGKSTHARAYFSSSSILSSDAVRIDMCGSGGVLDQSKNDQVFSYIKDAALARLRHGLETVIDATHLHKKDRLKHVALAPKGSIVTYMVVDRPLDQKLKDGDWRNTVTVKGRGLIEHHHEIFQRNLPDILSGDGLANVKVVDLRK